MKLIFTLPALFITLSLSAQLKQGDWNINTRTNAPMNLRLRSNGEGFKSYEFIINPGVGYFLKDRWEIGGGPLISLSGSNYTDRTSTAFFRNNAYAIGLNLFSRYYFKEEGRVIPYVTVNGGYAKLHGNSRNNYGIRDSYSQHQWNAGGGAGISWFLSSKFALFTELTYSGEWGSGLGYTHGLNFKVGFQLFLNKKNKESK